MKLKIKSLNKQLLKELNSKKGKIRLQIRRTIQSFNPIHNEIKEFNENYWSDYLFLLLSTIMTISNAYLYLSLFGELNIILKFVFLIMSLSLVLVLLTILLSRFFSRFRGKKII